MANPVLLAKAGLTVLTDERARKAAGWAVVAVLSPIILLVAFFCALGSGTSEHNVSAVELCFYGGVSSQVKGSKNRQEVYQFRDRLSPESIPVKKVSL